MLGMKKWKLFWVEFYSKTKTDGTVKVNKKSSSSQSAQNNIYCFKIRGMQVVVLCLSSFEQNNNCNPEPWFSIFVLKKEVENGEGGRRVVVLSHLWII